MLLCKEQQKPIIFMGREVRISDKVANAHYYLCNLPVCEVAVSVYVEFALRDDERNLKEKLKQLTDEDLTRIVEEGVKDEFLNLCADEEWNRIVE